LGVHYVQENTIEQKLVWEVLSTPDNYSYIYCVHTDSYAFFYNDGQLFWFTNFVGNKSSVLYVYFLTFYRVQLGYYPHLLLTDNFPLHLIMPGYLLWMHDFVAPFRNFFSGKYQISYQAFYDDFTEGHILTDTELTFNPASMYHFSAKIHSHIFHQKMECEGQKNNIRFKLTVNNNFYE